VIRLHRPAPDAVRAQLAKAPGDHAAIFDVRHQRAPSARAQLRALEQYSEDVYGDALHLVSAAAEYEALYDALAPYPDAVELSFDHTEDLAGLVAAAVGLGLAFS